MKQILDFIKLNNIQSFLDIGAHTGEISYSIKQNFPEVKLFAIEANKNCEPHIQSKGIPYKIACLSDTKKTVNFHLSLLVDRLNTGASYFKEKTYYYDEGSYTTETFETETLDDIFPDDTYEFIKLDTQGSELDILLGGKKIVQKASFLSIEVAVQEFNEFAPTKDQVFSYLESVGFRPVYMTEDHMHNGSIFQEDWIFEKVKNDL